MENFDIVATSLQIYRKVTVSFRLFSAPGDTLNAQYWQIIGGARIFTYSVASGPRKDQAYRDKIVGYNTGNDRLADRSWRALGRPMGPILH